VESLDYKILNVRHSHRALQIFIKKINVSFNIMFKLPVKHYFDYGWRFLLILSPENLFGNRKYELSNSLGIS